MDIRSTLCAGVAALSVVGLGTTAQAALTGHWDMEEGSGTTTEDQVSNTSSAAFGSGITWSTSTGAPGSTASLAFTGAGDVDTDRTGAQLNLTGTGAKTIVAWINTSASSGRQGIVSYSPTNGNGAGADLRLLLNADNGQLRLEISSGAAANDDVTLNDGNWHMVAAIIPDAATGADIDFYIDGDIYQDEIGSGTAVNTASSASDGGLLDLVIGNDQDGNDSVGFFNGLIDDVRVYDHALTESELDALFIPEPGSLALLGLGGLLMLGRRRVG